MGDVVAVGDIAIGCRSSAASLGDRRGGDFRCGSFVAADAALADSKGRERLMGN